MCYLNIKQIAISQERRAIWKNYFHFIYTLTWTFILQSINTPEDNKQNLSQNISQSHNAFEKHLRSISKTCSACLITVSKHSKAMNLSDSQGFAPRDSIHCFRVFWYRDQTRRTSFWTSTSRLFPNFAMLSLYTPFSFLPQLIYSRCFRWHVHWVVMKR